MQFATRRKRCTGLMVRQKQERLNGKAEKETTARHCRARWRLMIIG